MQRLFVLILLVRFRCVDRELDLLQKIKSEETEGDSATTESSKSEALSKLEKLEQKKADLKKQVRFSSIPMYVVSCWH